jgi:hypothetical protein
MSENIVTVNAAFGSAGSGNFLFAATGTLMTSAYIAIVTPVVYGILDDEGNLTAELLASDNYTTGELNWNCFLTVQGLSAIHVTDLAVDFSNGASQNLFTILAAAGWIPETT